MNTSYRCLRWLPLFLAATLVNGTGGGAEADKELDQQKPATTVVKMLGPEMQLTSSPVNDEDASIIRARDGYYYAAFWSARHRGFADIFMKRSADGKTWSDAWLVFSSPLADLGPQLCQTSDGTFHLVWWRGEPKGWRIPQNIYYINSRDTKAWSEPRKVTDTNTNDWGCHAISDDVYYRFFERAPVGK